MIRHNDIVIDRKKRTITHQGAIWQAGRRDSRRLRALTMLIVGGGVSLEKLFHHLFGGEEDGGPLEGPHIFHIYFQQWKPILEKLQLGLCCSRVAGVSLYSLAPLEAAPLAAPPTQPVGRTHIGRLAAPVGY